jgi:hypothetical protein
MNTFDKRTRGHNFGQHRRYRPNGSFGGDITSSYNLDDLSTATAQAKQDMATDSNVNNPIELTAAQSVGQWFQKATGQLNDKGDANGPGFMHSKLITYVEYAGIGVLVLGGLYLLGPVFTFGAAAFSSSKR